MKRLVLVLMVSLAGCAYTSSEAATCQRVLEQSRDTLTLLVENDRQPVPGTKLTVDCRDYWQAKLKTVVIEKESP